MIVGFERKRLMDKEKLIIEAFWANDKTNRLGRDGCAVTIFDRVTAKILG
jgi:hypothetical protein